MKAFSVYGGPGCGKSTELIRRVDRLRASGVPPERIAFVSFTKAATEEALSRIKGDKFVISTIHAMCYRKLGLKRQVVVNDSKLVKFFDELGVEYTREALDLDNVMSGVGAEGNEYLSVLALARARMSDPYDLYDTTGEMGTMAGFAMFVKSYEAWKDSYGFLDFSDMLEAAIHAKIGADYDIMFIDEAQDLSDQQWAVVRSMLRYGEVKEVHVGLDDDQTLYSWSGANPHGSADFENEFNAHRVVLPVSHRMPRSIHDLALKTIGQIEKRVDKRFGCRDDDGSVTEETELPEVRDNSLVLARTNMLVLALERELIDRRVPYSKLGSRGHGAWSTTAAKAVRVWRKFAAAEPITDIDETMVANACHLKYKQMIADGRMAEVLRLPWQDCVICTDRMLGFYEEVFDRLGENRNIRLGTVHASKGMEADNVYLSTEKTQRVMESAELDPDSEIRVEYVGITRARHNLTLIEGN